MTHLAVLLVDDSPDDRALIERELKRTIPGVRVEHAGSPETLQKAVEQAKFDLVITDYRLRWSTGTDVLREMKRRFPNKPVIMFTGSGNEEVAVNAMKEGLDDYITKTTKHYSRIPYAVLACFDRSQQREQLAQALERETLAKVRLEVALASAHMGTWQFDFHTSEILYSPVIGPMFGQPEGFTHGSFEDWLNDVHPEDRQEVMAAWDAATAGERDYVVQFRVNGADGQLRWIASSGKVIRNGGNLPKLITGTARDITHEVTRREQILQQQEELETILNVLPVGVAVSRDSEANHITLSPHGAKLLGVQPGLNISSTGINAAELPYRCYQAGILVQPEDLPMQRAAKTGMDIFGEELDMQLDDGRLVNLLINASPLKSKDGQVRGSVGALMDITALKKIQRELEAANEQKTEFLAVLSHELRNPMAAIGYSIELLRHVASPEKINKARMVIERQTAHMGRLLDDLLDLSRITRNKIGLDLKPLDLRRVVELGYEAAKSLIEPFGHAVGMDLPATPLYLLGDDIRLTQVITNLLGNAAKFTPPGGHITIRAYPTKSEVILEIVDDGIGIENDKLEQVFEMFYQGQPKASGGVSGLGIGLAIVQRIVVLHGGAIKAYSEGEGKGTRFEIALPVQSDARPDEPQQRPATPSRHQAVILIADDNVDIAELLSDVLRTEGYTVLTAYDGHSAMETAERHTPDLAILDIGMPFATGNEVARWIRNQPWGQSIPLIAITGWGQAEDRKLTEEAGFNIHLVKPVNTSDVLRLVSESLT